MAYKFEQDGLVFLEQLLPLCSDAVTMINQKGIVLYWNEGAEEIYRISKEKIIGEKISDFFQPKDLMVLRLLDHPYVVKGVYHNPRFGTHVVINASPVFDREGELIGAISVEQNITKLVKLNEELDQTSLQLNQLTNKKNQRDPAHPFSTIRGSSKKLHDIIKLADKVATTDATILITGESGVGKELFSRAIHSSSHREEMPFIPINCGAIPDALFESELFGYEAGAFTGASNQGKKGKLELANEGTLFLDEIGELPLEMQVKLLRALQEQEFYRVGGTDKVKVDVRIIAATNQDLEQQMAKGLFREDLFYRLNVFSIHIPALRERPEDIIELIQMFLIEFSSKYHKSIASLSEDVLSSFLQNDWPGNVRQLRNMIERYVILYDEDSTGENSFQKMKTKQVSMTPLDSLQQEKEELEKEWICEALRSNGGNKSAAARKLEMSRATLYQKMKRYKLSAF